MLCHSSHRCILFWNDHLWASGHDCYVSKHDKNGTIDRPGGRNLLQSLNHQPSRWVTHLVLWNGLLASGGTDGTVFLWDCAGRKLDSLPSLTGMKKGNIAAARRELTKGHAVTSLVVWNGMLWIAHASGQLQVWKIIFPES